MTAANLSYKIGRSALLKQALLFSIMLSSISFSAFAAATNFTLSKPTLTLSSSTAGASSSYTFKGKTPRTTGSDIPLNNTIVIAFPPGTTLTLGTLAGTVTYNGGG